MTKMRAIGLFMGISLIVSSLGCLGAAPSLPWLICAPPWVSERMEDKYTKRFRTDRAAIMPPILPGQPLPTCEDPPTDEEVIRALPKVARGVPFVFEEMRDSYEVVVEKLVDKIDPPAIFPVVGPAQLHHCHYKCTVFWREKLYSDWPFAYGVTNDRVEVIYIDKDHLHLVVGNDPCYQKSISRDLLGP